MTASVEGRLLTKREARYISAITINDDFTDSVSDVPQIVREFRPFAAGVQEVKENNLHQILGDNFGVAQRLRTEWTSGVALVWDKDQAYAVKGVENKPGRVGNGIVPIIRPQRGDDILIRPAIYQDLEPIGFPELATRFVSYHRPPQRHKNLWSRADANLENFVKQSPLPVIILTDGNQENGPFTRGRRPAGLRWTGVGIDGALTDVDVAQRARPVRKMRSDHRAVRVYLRLRSHNNNLK